MQCKEPATGLIHSLCNEIGRIEIESERVKAVEKIILTEVNVKNLELITDLDMGIVKKIKPNFKALGPRYGKLMKQIAGEVAKFDQDTISQIETNGTIDTSIAGEVIQLNLSDFDISTQDIPGWLVASEGSVTIALDVDITPELKEEGIAREFINRIQNFRKESGFDVTDKIVLNIQKHELINSAIENYSEYICSQTLALSINLVEKVEQNKSKHVEVDNEIQTYINIQKANS